MLFNSFDFLIFFIIVFVLYKVFYKKVRIQNSLLLISSYIFYGWWDPRFLYLIVLSTATDYCAGLMIDKGKLSIRQRVISSVYLLLSGFLFLVINWKSLINKLTDTGFSGEIIQWTSFEQTVLGVSAILVLLANVGYFFGKKLSVNKRRKAFLLLSVVVNLALLGFFKYYNFFADSFTDLLQTAFNYTPNTFTLNIILPVGISFYTFQTMSYTIDVYRKQLNASSHLLEFATYVAFFPQLVAGPIERGKHLLPQFRKARPSLKKEERNQSLWLITWGLFKKLVVADNMAVIVNDIFGQYDQGFTGLPDNAVPVIIGILAFAFQIYGDFSGYTDIARGVSKLMGFDIMLNFNLPYFAISPSDFWRRWHISLSSWLRDYLYISMGGNRKGKLKTYRNLFLTMLLGGLWHGAAWTFVIWGAFHGILLIGYRLLRIDRRVADRNRFQSFLLIIIMFIFTCVGWLIFRAQNIDTIYLFIKSVFVSGYDLTGNTDLIKTFIFYSWFIILYQFIQYFMKDLFPLQRMHWFLRYNIWLFVILSIFVLSSQVEQEFIYFAF